MGKHVPSARIRAANGAAVDTGGDFVLYWMIAARRTTDNFGLQRAAELAVELRKPLLVLEALRAGYEHACDRFHHFVILGMADNAAALKKTPALYHPYLEPSKGAGRGLLDALAGRACCVVTDDTPAFFLPRMVEAAAQKIAKRLEAVDSVGLLPFRDSGRDFPTAYVFRRHVQRWLPHHLEAVPARDPLGGIDLPRAGKLPRAVLARWPAADVLAISRNPSLLSVFPIDHAVAPAMEGGQRRAKDLVKSFVRERLERYPEDRNHPDLDATSGLSPYLHFGHVSVHAVFREIASAEGWKPEMTADRPSGKREGWWGMSAAAEEFLDQLVTWRELGIATAAARPDHLEYGSLPGWARETLRKHSPDRREHIYSERDLERAETSDEVWNSAQRQLVIEGRLHNYMRMLWGKKILEWSESPQAALETMLRLNDKYALDGRDPNSASGVFWCLGRYDRPFGPERPVFGKVRYMSSQNTLRKLRVRQYLSRFDSAEKPVPGGDLLVNIQ